jgi:hypothetical protein
MPYQSRAERERAQWRTLPEAMAHVCAADGCDPDDARRQLLRALTNGDLQPALWEDARPMGRAGGAAMPLDMPPGRDPHWKTVDIDWQAGTVQDDWGEAGPRHRVLLISRLRLREHWPETQPAAPAAEAGTPAIVAKPNEAAAANKARGETDDHARTKKRKARRDEKRPEIVAVIAALADSTEWQGSSDKERCRLVERRLDKPAGWCSQRTLSRAIAARAK